MIKIIDDKLIKKNKKFSKLILNKKDSEQTITINPFVEEHYNDIDLFNIKIFCDKNNIKLKVLSQMNYLPLNSQYADELIIAEDKNHMKDAYDLNGKCITTLGENSFKSNHEGFLNTRFYQKNFNPLERDCYDKTGIVKLIYKEICLNELNEFIKNKKTLIRKSTYDLFLKIKNELPKDIILCEIKGTFKKIKDKLKKQKIIKNLVGIDYEFQKELLRKTKHHYLGIQILGSEFLNWKIIALGGSGRLFSMLPTKNILLMARDIYGNDEKILPKKIDWIQKKNLPWIGNQINPEWELSDEELLKINELCTYHPHNSHPCNQNIYQDKTS